MLERIYGLSPRARLARQDGRPTLLCAYPLQRVELNPTAFALVGALDGMTPLRALVEPAPPDRLQELADFLEGLVAQGCLSVRYEVTRPAEAPSVEVVVPVLDNAPGASRCLAALAGQTYPRERWTVTLVDDGSAPPLAGRLLVPAAGLPPWRVLRLDSNLGPACARNAALAAPPDGPPADLVAFTDSDCVPAPEWLWELAGALEDAGLDAVGGRVLGLRRDRWLARYEGECASLNLGPRGGPVGRPGDRLAYLPACNLAVRRSALRAVGGFVPGLRMGEDVDLSWRLQERGFRLHYVPACAVRHAYRDRIGPFLRRKAAYGATEDWLLRRHPGRLPARPPRLPGVVLGLAALGTALGPAETAAALIVGAGLLAGEAARHAWRNRAALRAGTAWTAVTASGRRMAASLLVQCRAWAHRHGAIGLAVLPLTPLRPGLTLWLAAVLGAAAGAEWLARQPAVKPLEFMLGYALDVLGYSFGRWRGRLGTGFATSLKTSV